MDYRVVHLRSTACLVVRTSGQADPREQNASSPWSQRPALVQYLGLIHIPDRAGGAAAGDPRVSCVSTQREQECHCPNAQCEGQEQSATRGTPAGRRRYPEPLPIRRTRRRRVRRDHRPRTRLSPLPPRAAVDTADGLSFTPVGVELVAQTQFRCPQCGSFGPKVSDHGRSPRPRPAPLFSPESAGARGNLLARH